MRKVLCNYCFNQTKLVTGKEIYPHRKDLHKKQFYLCKPCDAYVGCHQSTDNPLGRVANAELRKAKNKAHAAFDPIWRDGRMKRKEAYKWLSEKLEINSKDCHIGMFDVALCNKVVQIMRELYENN